MVRLRPRGEKVRNYILRNIRGHPTDIVKIAAERFGITRQAINKHLQKLVSESALTQAGRTRNRSYNLAPLVEWNQEYEVSGLAEDVIWRNDVTSVIGKKLENVLDIWNYGFTEMLNNAIDHSGGSMVRVSIKKTAVDSEMIISDNGVGIFKKIQSALNLLDERHAVLELAKGKLTTDPQAHTGEGIFFTSRVFNSFEILSGGVYFSHKFAEAEDWILQSNYEGQGTTVYMKLNNHTARTTKAIFKQFSSGGDFGFNKTVVPVKLAQYENDKLISRSQAKRLLARVDLFKVVMFDFKDVEIIGQAFADEIFRVFPQIHPEIELLSFNANEDVAEMVKRAEGNRE